MKQQDIQLKKIENYFHIRKEELIKFQNDSTKIQKHNSQYLSEEKKELQDKAPLINIQNIVIFLEDYPEFNNNKNSENYRLIAKHSTQKAHWRFQEQNKLEDSIFMFSDDYWNTFNISNKNQDNFGQLYCQLNLYQKEDLQFIQDFNQLGNNVFEIKDEIYNYKKFQPNQKIKMRLYLTDLLLNQNKYRNIYFEIYLDNTLIQRKTLKNKKEIKKKKKFIGFKIDEKIKNCFNIGTYSTLKIIFYEQENRQDFNFQEIGRTQIDLNKRFNCNKWRNLQQIPIEKRILMRQDSLVQQGHINLWLEMFTKDQKISFPEYEISQYSQKEIHEVRVVIWSIENLGSSWGFKNDDNFLRVSMNTDIFPYQIDQKFSHENQFTEPIRIKNQQNKVQINHRFIWRFQIDGFRKNFNSLLNIKITNDFEQYNIDRKLDCSNQLEEIIKQKKGRKSLINNIQELLCFSEENPQDILNEEEISKKPAGIGRNYPNANPYLPDPKEEIIQQPQGFMGFNKKQIYLLVITFFGCFFITLISTYFLTKTLI